VQWYSPGLTGSVDIGSLPSDYTVQASNPTLENLSTLYWEFSGPTAINYILTDNAIARQAGDNLFWAGVLAALATGFLVECLKTCYEIRGEVADVREIRERRKEREEAKRERAEEREEFMRIVADQTARPSQPTVPEISGLTTLNRWLASALKRNR
jgi:hypothetical protein